MQDLLQNQKQNAGINATQVAPKKADKSLPNSPDATLVQKLKELFVPPPAAPQTDEYIVVEAIKNLLHGQESSRGNGRGRGRGSRGGARGNYQGAKPGGYYANVQCHYCKQTGHIQRHCTKKRADFNNFSADKVSELKAAPMGNVRSKEATEPAAKMWRVSSGPMVVQPVLCNGLQVDAIIDTGACLSAISPVVC